MTNPDLAKTIRGSILCEHAYLNSTALGRLRIYGAVAKRDGTLKVKVTMRSPAEMGHGSIAWLTVGPKDSVTIFACTPMEETYGGGKVRI